MFAINWIAQGQTQMDKNIIQREKIIPKYLLCSLHDNSDPFPK